MKLFILSQFDKAEYKNIDFFNIKYYLLTDIL